MKILFISDIHGIVDNLKYLEAKIKEEHISKLVCLGDLYYTNPLLKADHVVNEEEVLNFLNRYKDILICMKGNCDSLEDIEKSTFPINKGLNLINVDDLDIYITHGNEYSLKAKENFPYKGILVYGHEHRPYIKKKDDVIYINVGSISLPISGKATYVIYEKRKFIIYDITGKIIDSIEI